MALFNNIHSHKINMNIGARYRILIFLIKLVFKGLVFINFENSQLSLGGSHKLVTIFFFKSKNQSLK